MCKRLSAMLLLVVASGAILTVACASASAPKAQIATTCNIRGQQRSYGYSYLTSLKVTRISCTAGKKVVKHHGHVHGWRCSTKRTANSPVQYDARETCKSGRREIVWTFTQNK